MLIFIDYVFEVSSSLALFMLRHQCNDSIGYATRPPFLYNLRS